MDSRLKERIRPPLPEGPYLVVGLGRSGQAVARMLVDRGFEVSGCDAGSPKGADSLGEAGMEIALGNEEFELLDGISTLVKSPGVSRESPLVGEALRRGVEVTGELEVAWRALPNRFCAITGTNGKSTVTELVAWIFDRAGAPAAAAGNVGTPLASLVGRVDPDTTIVCECSSFQLEDAEAFSPEVAVLLNLTPDHLDRHGSMARYLEAKLKIFARQIPGDFAVINGSEESLAKVDLPGAGEEISFCSGGGALRGDCDASVADGFVRWRGQDLIAVSDLALSGAHNQSNAAAAVAAAVCAGVDPTETVRGLSSFEGIPHRMETVGSDSGVTYVNDSKATNVAAAIAAIETYDGGIRLILGGSLKDESFEPLVESVRRQCRGCYLTGEAAGAIEETLAPVRESGVEVARFSSLTDAFEAAADAAESGETVLLSPACASFDEFTDFEDRGDTFRRLAKERISR